MSRQPRRPTSPDFRRHHVGELIFVGSLAITVITAAAIGVSAVTGGRVAAAFAEPIAYARSFFDRNALAPYAVPADASNLISIEFDPATGDVIGPRGSTPPATTVTGATGANRP
ncbi:MAG: hypothetical protein HY534_04460 [Chloroflexi bacterium]|nr:hypothetical protein [Chloroflexota bacterium]